MKWYQRVEVWVLFLLATGAIVYVSMQAPSQPHFDTGLEAGDVAGGTAPSRLKIHRCVLVRDHGNARLDIEARVTNQAEVRLAMQPPAVRLEGPEGREIPPFFLPFNPPPELSPGGTQDVQLRYWLEKGDLAGPLTLHVQEEQVPVKSPAPFDLGALENGRDHVLKGVDWNR